MASNATAGSSLKIFHEPQCLIDTRKDGKLEVQFDLIAELESLQKPLVVVAIAGLYRTGKSYLMNRLAGKTDGKWIQIIAELTPKCLLVSCCLLRSVLIVHWQEILIFQRFCIGLNYPE